MSDDGYDRSRIIGGFGGPKVKNSMLGRNIKSREFLSNQLAFSALTGGAPYNPLQFLWPTGTEKGAYWRFDQSGFEFQDSAGATPVTAVDQSIGMIFDSRFGPTVGPETILNTSFDTPANWTPSDGSIVIGNGFIQFTSAPHAANAQSFGGTALVAGTTYQITAVINSVTTAGALQITAGGITTNFTTPGTKVFNITATGVFQLAFKASGVTSAVIDSVSCKSIPGNHLLQATSTARPLSAVETIGGWNQSVYSSRFDGIDDGIAVPAFVAGTLNANMDFFCAIKRTAVVDQILLSNGTGNASFIGAMDGTAGTTGAGVGAYTLFVDGVAIPDTRLDLSNAIGSGAWHVLEYRNLNLSAWVQLTLGLYPALMLSANIGPVVLCQAQSQANRDLARRIVGASVGVLL